MTIEVCVRVSEAKELYSNDPNGTSDPFYLIGLADANKNNQFKDPNACVRSKAIFCTLHPVWGKAQRADFITTVQDPIVRIEIWDKDHALTNDFEGYSLIDVTFQGVDSTEYWVDLLPRNANEKVTGSVLVNVSWNYNYGVHSCVTFNKEQRAARVFLSSTFVDMHEERETIMRKVMVELEQFCYDRQVSLTYIDMRWGISFNYILKKKTNNRTGITDDMSKEYKTILSCLQEVNTSRPYFVGIIGQRYGWHQEKDGADPILTKTFELAASHQEYEWINKFRDRSVTELEILHGFLLHPSLPTGHTFFYFRDPNYLTTLDDDSRNKFQDTTPYAITHLDSLKERIRNKAGQWDCTLVENYQSPNEMGNLLLSDLKKAIDRDFPIVTSTLSTAQKQRLEHENYAHQRCHAYVPRPQYFSLLDGAVQNLGFNTGGRYVLVTGESGSGKSSLMANWWKSRTHLETEVNTSTKGLLANVPTFIHFIGASSMSHGFTSLLLRLYDEINETKKPNEPKIEKPKDDEIVKSLPKFLKAASLRGGMVIVFDAINQLPSKYHDLHWLPTSLPPKICILISSTPESKMLEAVKQRSGGSISTSIDGAGEGKWTHISVQALENEERKLIVQTRLSKYGKKMAPEDIERIVSHPCSKLPLFITTVLLELCTIGFYDKFKEQLANFLSGKDMPDLFRRVLQRWEESFGADLAERLLPLLANSRSGVSEKIIQVATQAPAMQLSPMLTAMKQMLVVNQSIYNFGHIYLKEAVLSKYSPAIHYAASCKLAEVLSLEHFNETVAAKLPWILEKVMMNPLCKDSAVYQQRLADILLDLRKFMVFYEHDTLKYDLIKYWDKLMELNKSKWKMGPLYVESAKNSLKRANAKAAASPLPSTSSNAPLLPTPIPVATPPTHVPPTASATNQNHSNSSQVAPSATTPSSLSSKSSLASGRIRSNTQTPASRPSNGPSTPSPPSTSKAPPSFPITPETHGPSTLRKTSSIASVGLPPSTDSPTTALRKTSSSAHVSSFNPPQAVSPNPPSSVKISATIISTANSPAPAAAGSLAAKVQAMNTKNLAPTPTISASTNPGRLRTSSTVYNKSPVEHSKFSAPSVVITSSSTSSSASSPNSGTNSPKTWEASKGSSQHINISLGANRQQPPRASSPTPTKPPAPTTSTTPLAPIASVNTPIPVNHITPVTAKITTPTSSSTTPTNSFTRASPSANAAPKPVSVLSSSSAVSSGQPSPTRAPVAPLRAPPPVEVAPGTFFALSSFLFSVGLIHEAQEVGELSLSEYRKTEDKNGIARALYLLGVILRDQGYLDKARTYLIQALDLRVELFGEVHPEVATSLDKLGWLLKSSGELIESLKYFTRALAIQKKMFGNRHEEVASTLNGLGSILCELGNLAQAREYFDEALSAGSELFGMHHPNVAQTLHNIGVLCFRQEKWEEALDFCSRARAIREEVLGIHHVDVAASLSIVGTVLLQKEKFVEAEDCFKKAHKIQSELLGLDNPEVAVTLANLGVLEKRRGNLPEARKYNEGALQIRSKLFGPQHPLVEASLNNLGGCCYSQGDFEKARECFDKVLDLQVARLGGYANPRVQQTLTFLESIAKRQGKPEDAKGFAAKLVPKTPQ